MNPDEIPCCPECGDSDIHTTNANPVRVGRPEAHYCGQCGSAFNEADRRERGQNGGVIHGTHANALLEADPSAVGGGDA